MTIRRFKLWTPDSQVVPNAMVEDPNGEYILVSDLKTLLYSGSIEAIPCFSMGAVLTSGTGTKESGYPSLGSRFFVALCLTNTRLG